MQRLWAIKSEETGSPNPKSAFRLPFIASSAECNPTSERNTDLSDEMLELQSSPVVLLFVIRWSYSIFEWSAALLNHEDVSKLKVSLRNFYGSHFGTGIDKIYDGSNDHPNPVDFLLVYPRKVDFFNTNSVRALNRWRNAIFGHYLGTGLETISQRWHSVENGYLMQAYAELEAQPIDHPVRLSQNLRSWVGITRDFNNKFEGRIFPGEEKPRAPRTEEELRQQWNRLSPTKRQVRCDRLLKRSQVVKECRARRKKFSRSNPLLLNYEPRD